MIKINSINIHVPKTPSDQVFDSNDLDLINSKNIQLKSKNFYNIINNKNLKEIKYNWESSLLKKNYTNYTNSYFLLEIESEKDKYKGIICGISTDILKRKLVFPHENVSSIRVEKLKNYLKTVKIQAEPVVIATRYTKDIIIAINLASKNKPILSFDYKKIKYMIKKINIKNSINNFSSFFIVDGHHRLKSLNELSDQLKSDFQLLTLLTEISSVKSNNFIWKVYNPSSRLIKRLIQLNRSNSKPNLNSFWANFKNKYYVFDKSNLKTMSINYFEKWITSNGDIISHINPRAQTPIIHNSNTIIFNYPPISFNKIVKSNKNKLLPKKTTYLEPKIVTGLIISSLK